MSPSECNVNKCMCCHKIMHDPYYDWWVVTIGDYVICVSQKKKMIFFFRLIDKDTANFFISD
jgi:hypothetical protein